MPGFRVRVEGIRSLDRKMQKIPVVAHAEVKQAIAEAATAIVTDIKDQMLRSKKSGRVYSRARFPPHQASAQGEYPAVDTGAFISSVEWEREGGGLEAVVGTNQELGVWLEFGTTRMLARPWLFPSFTRVMGKHRSRIANAIREGIKRVARR